ncbi:hypothetical protein NIES2119_19630 [[Phormidium ambiguum] IAM M-71]|uniref:Uncharacterized protein n=1 Tax=[Phormidium ambiguum] IAM M-71 TaxID=454136 RepID=A0A1U7IFG2_9CYAN|nr:hypothetical protein [Phormidium ambiguum]OKH35710.1 hypothetical protein NIES2119_19630 [Phormidium ambiguum IAM M-71]
MDSISKHNLAQFIPLLRRAVWCSLNLKLNCYFLPDGSFVFTFRQIANPVAQPSQSVRQFLEKTQTLNSVISAYLPNHLLANVCTLKTAAEYWKNLELTQSEETKKANNTARKLWLAAEQYLNSLANDCNSSDLEAPSSAPNCLKVSNIFHLKLLGCTHTCLRVFTGKQGEQKALYLIEVSSFLELLGIESDWLVRPLSPVRRFLQPYGLAREQIICYLDNGEEVLAFTLLDCLAICEYLIIKKGNSRAADFLIALAQIPLESRCQQIARCSQD